MNNHKEELAAIAHQIELEDKKRARLRDLDLIVFDNSLRESTVGQLRGHTLENKFNIYRQSRKCGFKNIIVASFSHTPRVDDTFFGHLQDQGEDMSPLMAFSDVTESIKDGLPNTEDIPIALLKMQKLGIHNPIIEIDLADSHIDWQRFTGDDMCKLLDKWISFAHYELSLDSRVHINLRDFPFAMAAAPERVLDVITFLAKLPDEFRPKGIMYEEPTGKFLPEEMGAWTASIRRVMDENGWESGNLLVHVHRKWGIADDIQPQCLIHGANGIWASLCEEGASLGHACSTVTIMNLVRLGNKKVLDRYNCTELRNAAAEVTRLTIGRDPDPRQTVYGERALDLSFDFGRIAGGRLAEGDFDIAAFFGVQAPVRISTLASARMVRERMVDLFGEDPQFTDEMGERMKAVMIEDLKAGRKEEYMSSYGIALLFDRSGGKLTKTMREVISAVELVSQYEIRLVQDVRTRWERFDLREGEKDGDFLPFEYFWEGFMTPYFGCVRCEDTLEGLTAIDMDQDGRVN
ncbi:MAG: isopropylmalate/homocitrate/citramalate synthase [Verrucomicrobiales bacterium]|jgi:isopropylmalate/homocitrate/citramalate synthase